LKIRVVFQNVIAMLPKESGTVLGCQTGTDLRLTAAVTDGKTLDRNFKLCRYPDHKIAKFFQTVFKKERRIQNGDEWAALVYKAQALQIAKGIGTMLACFTELIDAVILTGGLAHSKMLTGMVVEYLHNLTRVVIIPGENEMEGLAMGGLRILRGKEEPQIYHRPQ